MKRIFVFCVLFAFVFVSCGGGEPLYDAIVAVSLEKEFLAGNIICYGNMHENRISEKTLCTFLGLDGFDKKVEEMASYSSVGEKYEELTAVKVYRAADVADAVLSLERRVKSVKRAGMFKLDTTSADTAEIFVYGNTAVLYMTGKNAEVRKLLEKML